jgi:hypothetical protein
LVPVCTEPKFKVDGVSVAAGAVGVVAVPLPVRVDVCVPTLSITVSDAEAVPVAVGANEMLIVHEAPAASEVTQVFPLSAKE